MSREMSKDRWIRMDTSNASTSEDCCIGEHLLVPGAEIKVDDEHACVVLVFPKGKNAADGVVDEHQIIKNPYEQAQKIFARKQSRESIDTTHSGFAELQQDELYMSEYQSFVREKIVQVFKISGFQAESFFSIDGDETFVKLSLKPDGEAIGHLAARYNYPMQMTAEAYEHEEPHGDYLGHAPMKNSLGDSVPVHHGFKEDLKEFLVPFSNVDEIRLILLRLNEWLNLEECVKQQVISRYFPSTKYAMLTQLNEQFAKLNRIVCLPTHDHEPYIHAYFGEDIAMFFRWFAFYVRMLLPLGILGGIAAFRRLPSLALDIDTQRWIQISFAFVLVVWTSCFNKLFVVRSSRASQKWGSRDPDKGHSVQLSSYDPDLEGTYLLHVRRYFSRGCMVGFIFLQIIGVWVAENMKVEKRQAGDEQFCNIWAPLMTAISIKGGGFIWGKIAPLLTMLQNHRTAHRYQNDLTFTLATVKIFVALWPFFVPAFLRKYTDVTCKDTLKAAAQAVYGGSGWPDNVDMSCGSPDQCVASVVDSDSEWEWLRQATTQREGKECIFGCYPVDCTAGPHRCVTNCIQDLEFSLLTVFFIHVGITLTLLLIPMVLVRWEVKKEMDKVQQDGDFNEEDEGSDRRMYTLLQLQSKCAELAPYQYHSSGGSRVEDFLELAIGFALLTCFGQVLPGMALLAFVSHMIEYRLIAFRMTNVTCRPVPLTALDIGEWQTVFNALSYIAIIVNAALACFVMHPMRGWDSRDEFLAFILMENGLLMVKIMIMMLVPNKPEDVLRIEDFNSQFVHSSKATPQLTIPPSEMCDYNQLSKDVSLELADSE